MPSQAFLSTLSGIVFLLGFVPYIRAIVSGETKPSKMSWLIWASLDVITLIAMLYQHSVNGQIIGAVSGAFVVLALAMKYGKPGWTTLDKFCLAGAILGIVLWQTTSNPDLGIVVSAMTAVIGSIPTFVNAWKNPQQEDFTAWTIFWISCVMAMLAIPKYTIADAAQPISFTIIESTVMFILLIRRRSQTRAVA